MQSTPRRLSSKEVPTHASCEVSARAERRVASSKSDRSSGKGSRFVAEVISFVEHELVLKQSFWSISAIAVVV